jgi:hypothetical protein
LRAICRVGPNKIFPIETIIIQALICIAAENGNLLVVTLSSPLKQGQHRICSG